ncbi:hypothetical protein JTB14_001423 [Gonioctena quinquepunctata]|nr:hypothetical protein JTB14_001423 [Gonioctena quinquepunctata]
MNNKITLTDLNKRIKTIKNRQVSWETRKPEMLITLCRNCQTWGHTAPYCIQPFQFVNCGAVHKSETFTKSTSTDCDEAHPSNYKGCIAYSQALIRSGKQPLMDNTNRRRPPTQPQGGQGGRPHPQFGDTK